MRKIYLDRIGSRRIAALVEDGELEDLVVDPLSKALALPGAVFRGIAERPLKTLGGIIMNLGGGEKGFLRGGQGTAVGSSIVVEVIGCPADGKLPPLSTKVKLKGRFAIATLGSRGINVSRSIASESVRHGLKELASSNSAAAPDDTGFIVRTSSESAQSDLVAQEVRKLSEAARRTCCSTECPKLLIAAPTADEIARREWHDHNATDMIDGDGSFEEYGIWELIQTHLAPTVELPSGGRMQIEETSAFVAVDIDTRADLSRQAGRNANLEAARRLPRELRLRGIGGQVVVDFAPMPKNERRAVTDAMLSSLAHDRALVDLAGWTPLGHFELRRKRLRQPLRAALPK